jgi:hypothetical protein
MHFVDIVSQRIGKSFVNVISVPDFLSQEHKQTLKEKVSFRSYSKTNTISVADRIEKKHSFLIFLLLIDYTKSMRLVIILCLCVFSVCVIGLLIYFVSFNYLIE